MNKSPPRPANAADDWGDYSFCSQLIKWDSGEYSIRLAYYRRRIGEDWWEFASQTTVSSDWRTIKELLGLTLAKKSWFREKLTRFSGHLIKSVLLMEEVFNEQVREREFEAATPRL